MSPKMNQYLPRREEKGAAHIPGYGREHANGLRVDGHLHRPHHPRVRRLRLLHGPAQMTSAAVTVGATTAALATNSALANSGDSLTQSLRHDSSSGGFFSLYKDAPRQLRADKDITDAESCGSS